MSCSHTTHDSVFQQYTKTTTTTTTNNNNNNKQKCQYNPTQMSSSKERNRIQNSFTV